MKRILIVSNPQSPGTDYYRTVGPFIRLEEQYPTHVRVSTQSPDKLTWFHLFSNDIIIFQRPNGNEIVGYIMEAKAMGRKVIIDIDDLLHGIPESSPAYKHFNTPGIGDSVVSAMKMADHIIFSTAFLESFYNQYTPETVGKTSVIQNAWDEAIHRFAPIAQQHNPVRMMWRGSMSHLGDLQTIKGEMRKMMQRKNFETVFVGMPAFMGYDLPPAKYLEWQTLFTYFRLIRESQPDYGFFPLEDNAFNHAKSNIFAIEMLSAGAVPIVPRGFAEWDIPGLLRYSTPGGFTHIIDRIAAGKMNREERIEEGRKFLRDNFSIESRNELRLKIVMGM